MRISTKIILGYAVLIVLMIGLLTHEVYSLMRMQSIIAKLSNVNFRSADIALQMMRDLDLVDFFAQKSFVSDDPGYPKRLQEYVSYVEADVRNFEFYGRSRNEQAEIQRLNQAWAEFLSELDREQRNQQSQSPKEVSGTLVNHLDRLRDLSYSAYLAARAAIDAEVQASKQTGETAQTVSWIVAAVALLLAALVSFLIVQSISSPLKQLTQGTNAIAEGKFFYRLDTSRRDEFAQLAKDFNTMTHRLNELDQMKKDFVSHISHELKAPIVSMQETIQLLLDGIPGPLSDKQRRLLELNLAGGRRLSAMIGNILDLSRMEAGVMEYEIKSNDLPALVRTAVAELHPLASERELAFEIEAPEQAVMLECDGDRILQVIRNLMGNAVKFSPKGETIRIRIAKPAEPPASMPESWMRRMPAQGETKGFALVSVADAGPGVPDEHKEKIFEKFHQVKQGRKSQGQGAGLGLAICRTITEAHRGAIWVEDNVPVGSVFHLMIPLGESSEDVTYRKSSPI